MKKETLVFIILVIFLSSYFGFVVKPNKQVFVTGIHDSPYPPNTTRFHKESIHVLGIWIGDEAYCDSIAAEISKPYDSKDYWTAPATGVYETSSEQYLILSAEDTTGHDWSLEVEEGTQLTFIKSPQFTGDEIVYLGVETVVDTIDAPPLFGYKDTYEYSYALNLRINNTEFRIALEEVE